MLKRSVKHSFSDPLSINYLQVFIIQGAPDTTTLYYESYSLDFAKSNETDNGDLLLQFFHCPPVDGNWTEFTNATDCTEKSKGFW